MAATTELSELARQQCCERDNAQDRLSAETAAPLLKLLHGWVVEGDSLVKTFKFMNYEEVIAFVNATAWISYQQDHHPDLEVGYNAVTMRYSTHSVGGLSMNDFICAAKVEALMEM